MPPGVGQRDGDAVDGVGRQGDHPARTQALDRPRDPGGVVRHAPRPRRSGSPVGHAMRAIRAWTASSARRSAVARASRGLASTSDSIIVATPSSSTGGAT